MPRIAVDAMGGDHAPEQVVLGAIDAAKAGHDPVLVGDTAAIKTVLDDFDLPVVAASQVIEMEDDPARSIREKKDASISVAARLVADAYKKNRFDGMIALGGTMGTDLGLDCAQALPLGVPKYIVSTVSFSPLIPPHRLAADVQMILWAGGLFGMNPICRSSPEILQVKYSRSRNS